MMLWVLFLLGFITSASAQTVQQGGTVTYGHVGSWATSGILQDGGTATQGKINSLGLYGNGGTPFCITSSPTSAPFTSTSLWTECMGVSSTLGGYLNVSGASMLPWTLNVNGTAAIVATPTGITVPDLTSLNPATTRTGLGLGTMATQNANAVAVTGGAAAGLTSLGVSNGIQGATLTPKSTTNATGMPGAVLDTQSSGQQLILNPTGGPTKVGQLWNMEYPGNYYPTINLAGANPLNQFLFGAAITGTYGSGIGPLNRFWVNDSADATPQGDNPPVLSISYTKTGGKGFGEALSTSCGLNTNITNGNYLTCFENRANPAGNAGGTSLTSPLGQNNAQNNYAILQPGATFWINNSIAEENVAVMAGASSQIQTNRQYARLGSDWGDVGTTTDTNAFAGRYGLWLTSQPPAYDGTSTNSATRSAGNNLPSYKSVFVLGGASQEFIGDANTSLFSFFPQVFPNNNSCTVGVSNCPATTAAASIRTQTLGTIMPAGNVHIAGEAWRTPGIVIKGTGEIDVGNGSIAPSTQGLVIDTAGSYVTSATYVGGNNPTAWKVGEYLYGSGQNGTVPGAILRVASVDGTGKPNSLTVVDPGYSSASAAINNASSTLGTAAQFMGHGTNTITLTWTDALEGGSGKPSVVIAPTNGHVTIGAGSTAIQITSGVLSSQKDIQTTGSFTASNNLNIKNNGSNGGYGSIGNNGGSNLTFKNYGGSSLISAYYDMNSLTPGWTFNYDLTLALGAALRSSAAVAPTIACTGGSGTPSISGSSTSVKGFFQGGTAPTSCTITWAATLASAPTCVVTGTTAAAFPYITATSTTSMTVNFSAAYSGSVSYICIQ